MSGFRHHLTRLVAPLIIAALLALLWAPIASLAWASLQVLATQPQKLFAALPLRGVARSMFTATLQLTLATVFLTLIFGVITALSIARFSPRPRAWALLFSSLPLAVPPTLGATAWLEWTRTPPLRALAALGSAVSPDKAVPALWWSQLWVAALVLAGCFYPVVALLLWAALRALPRELNDAAQLFGSRAQAWREVWWPQLWPVIGASCGIVAVLTMWEMGATDLLDVRTYSVQIYRDLSAPDALDASGKAVKAALAGWPLLCLSAGALFPLWRVRNRAQRHSMPNFADESETISAFVSPLSARILTIGALCLWLFSPGVAMIIWLSQLEEIAVFSRVWSANGSEISNSVLLSALGTLAILGSALVAVSLWRTWPERGRAWARTIAVLPLLIAPVLVGVALIGWYNRPGWDWVYAGWPATGNVWLDNLSTWLSRYAMMLVGYGTRFGPLAWWLLDAFDQTRDSALEDAAHNLGANAWRTARDVTWPLWRPALAGIGALVWSLCAGELSVSVLINAPGGQTLPVPVFNLMHIGATSEVAALSLTLLLVAALPLGIVGATAMWKARRQRTL